MEKLDLSKVENKIKDYIVANKAEISSRFSFDREMIGALKSCEGMPISIYSFGDLVGIRDLLSGKVNDK